MPGKYRIHAEFSLETRIEPEGVRFRGGDAEEFKDTSYFSDGEVEVYGGEVSFVVEAEDEDDAESKSTDEIFEGMETEDANGFVWVVTGLNVKVEEIVPPMDMEKAVALLKAILDRLVASGQINAEEQTAILFVLESVTGGGVATP
jgi:hypothetical protein